MALELPMLPVITKATHTLEGRTFHFGLNTDQLSRHVNSFPNQNVSPIPPGFFLWGLQVSALLYPRISTTTRYQQTLQRILFMARLLTIFNGELIKSLVATMHSSKGYER